MACILVMEMAFREISVVLRKSPPLALLSPFSRWIPIWILEVARAAIEPITILALVATLFALLNAVKHSKFTTEKHYKG